MDIERPMVRERPLEGVSILVVDDHDETRAAVADTLALAGARVRDAPSAQSGFLMLEQHRPDLLLTDLEMPDVDGWEFLRAVRMMPPERGGRTPAVAITAHNTQEDRQRSLIAGFRLHLAKPFEATELVNVLAALLATDRRDPKVRRHKQGRD
jgi:CheY-like chemotaxis protein